MNDPIACDYETDFAIWLNNQIDLLRAREFDQLDVDNLIEELNWMNTSYKRELRHRLETLLMHLLKCQFQPSRISSNWRGTIHEQRSRIGSLLEAAPSLARLIPEYVEKMYPHALRRAADETGLPGTAFPTTNPYTQEQLLDNDFLP